ncbi:hypothetical protein EYC84_002404 [Monilinia fructicola]|uniref:Uncharacterized protein n=1 Tax=Monilinia fructicola TaxID=38448 RepID=A0A5M9JN34_MONFR|nr:hypothetical protein EYC84_002404 [Monilinia fructicola]
MSLSTKWNSPLHSRLPKSYTMQEMYLGAPLIHEYLICHRHENVLCCRAIAWSNSLCLVGGTNLGSWADSVDESFKYVIAY